jgi:pyruvate,water dikinase
MPAMTEASIATRTTTRRESAAPNRTEPVATRTARYVKWFDEIGIEEVPAIVTNRGGRTCHAAIVSRELGVPAIVGTEHGTELLKDGQIVTVSCAEGDTGFVYEGRLPFDVERTNLKDLARPKTKVMMNVGNPEEAFALSFIPNDGVGLAREEFIITTFIKIHPLALLNYSRSRQHG